MTHVPDETQDDLMRELFARFGLAYYHSEVLHRGLCIFLAMSDLPRRDLVTRPRVEERLAHAFSLTLGDVIGELSGKIPRLYAAQLDDACKKRNFLAHHFWFDRCHLMFQIDHIRKLIDELNGCTILFDRLDKEFTRSVRGKQQELGLTDEIFQSSLNEIVSGKDDDPLPGKKIVKEREKKLGRRQRLVRVWEFDLPEGGKPLVFEMQDGSIWQLCDVGLGWSPFQRIESHWVQQAEIQRHLPADICPRPKNIKPWHFEFKLNTGTVLWVKPGRRPQSFQWGLKAVQK